MLNGRGNSARRKLYGQGQKASSGGGQDFNYPLQKPIHEGILQVDLEGNIVYASKKLFEILGYTTSEVLGKRSSLFLRAENRSVLGKIITDRKNGLSSKYELSVPAKSGEIKHFLISGTPYTNMKGEITGSIGSFTDITDVKQHEKLNRETENKLVEISKTVNLGFYIFSLQTKTFQYLSPAFENLYEVGLDEIYATNSIRKFVHPEDLDSVINKNRGNLSSGEIDVKYRIVTPSGTIKWINDRGRLIKNERGQVVKIIGYAQDVSGLMQTQEKLVKSEKEKQNIINAIPDSFMIINNKREIIRSYFKPQEYQLLCTSHKFINGKKAEQVFSPELNEIITDNFERVISESKMLIFDLEVEGKVSRKWFEFRITLIDEKSVLITIRNITDQKNNILRIQKLFNITGQTQDIIVITDTAGRIEYVNPTFGEVTGYDEKEILNSNISILKSGKHTSGFYKQMWNTLNKRISFSGVFENKKKNGKLFVEEKVITPFMNLNGEVTNFISIGRVIKGARQKNVNTIKSNPTIIKRQNTRTLSLIQGEENERKKYAKKIHEGLNQMLSAALMNLESLDVNNHFNSEEKAKIELVNKMVTEIMQELRGVSANLSPIGLSDFGLLAVVKQLVNRLNVNDLNVKFILESNITGLRFKNEIEINYFRIIQEAVQNILKHSAAGMVEIKLEYVSGVLRLRIKDDGTGIDRRNLNKIKMKKYGVLNIEERAKGINAELRIKTALNKGFEIQLITKTKKISHD